MKVKDLDLNKLYYRELWHFESSWQLILLIKRKPSAAAVHIYDAIMVENREHNSDKLLSLISVVLSDDNMKTMKLANKKSKRNFVQYLFELNLETRR